MTRRTALLAATCGAALALALPTPSDAAPAPKSRPAAKAAAKPARAAPKPATSRQKLQSKAKSLALATRVTEQISEKQLAIAKDVFTGRADCELGKTVQVAAVDGQPGHFQVTYAGKHYVMIPYETTTGAVRLEDRKAGIQWIQIPVKSMLMDGKAGKRLVDVCMHDPQRAEVAANEAAARAGSPSAAPGGALIAAPAAPTASTAAAATLPRPTEPGAVPPIPPMPVPPYAPPTPVR